MFATEKNYEFRQKMLEIHKPDIRNTEVKCSENEYEIKDGFTVSTEQNAGKVIMTAAKDFCDYLFTSMNVSVMLKKNAKSAEISVRLAKKGEDLGKANGYMGYKINVDDKISIVAFDERGAAQALYYLEDLMTLKKAPLIQKGETARKAMFSPRMIHSGYGIDWFPDEHLAQIAHSGMDAILLFVKGVNITTTGYLDFNELIYRAEKYGIDVYAYSYIKSEKHPEDEDAESYYESTYGELFKNCPKLKGVIFVGESCAFPSKDPNTTGRIERTTGDGIPSEKIHPGWWACYDYPEWLEVIKKVIRKHNSEADIVLWTYNWGWTPEDIRLNMLRTLPKDISLLVTYEMGESFEVDGVTERCVDYTLSFEGPGRRFVTEAKVAKECGIRLYSMTNTGGLTWDIGTIPYEPFPYQWQRRYDGIIDAHEKYGLSGLMESHHFGFYPSFISELAKWNFTEDENKPEDILLKILASHFGENNAEKVNEAMKLWSEAVRHYVPTNNDQYGPFRIGPAYPLNFTKNIIPPAADYAHFGTTILKADYEPFYTVYTQASVPQIALYHEMKMFDKMEKLMVEGVEILEKIENPNDELLRLINLGKYIVCCVRTTINTKRFCAARMEMNAETDVESVLLKLDEMEKIAREEIENAKAAIPLVRCDSRLGWEPSMEYLGDEAHINWKIRQVEYMLSAEIGGWREGIEKTCKKQGD